MQGKGNYVDDCRICGKALHRMHYAKGSLTPLLHAHTACLNKYCKGLTHIPYYFGMGRDEALQLVADKIIATSTLANKYILFLQLGLRKYNRKND